jgi:hypothetical protein
MIADVFPLLHVDADVFPLLHVDADVLQKE